MPDASLYKTNLTIKEKHKMSIKDIFIRKKEDKRSPEYLLHEMLGISFGSSAYSNDHAMKLSAVYRAVNCISDSIAQLPLEIFQIDKNGYKVKDRKNPVFSVLNAKPNKRMTRYTFISLLIQSMLLKGNAFAYIL